MIILTLQFMSVSIIGFIDSLRFPRIILPDSMIDGDGGVVTDPVDPGSSTTPSVTPSPEGYQRTVVFIEFQSQVGEDMFLRGGNRYDENIPISYSHVSYPSAHYDGYNSWAVGDNYLDWHGAENGQGSYNGKQADGSPLAWTTNSPTSDPGYNSLNKYGKHYWIWDVEMDCSATTDGWFELKGIVNGNWEGDITQPSSCSGSGSGSRPYSSQNHMAKCGFVNVFHFGRNDCQIDKL